MDLNLTDEERAAPVRLLRDTIDGDRFPLSPRLAPIKAVLAKAAAAGVKRKRWPSQDPMSS